VLQDVSTCRDEIAPNTAQIDEPFLLSGSLFQFLVSWYPEAVVAKKTPVTMEFKRASRRVS
jgi:hypothetical protein